MRRHLFALAVLLSPLPASAVNLTVSGDTATLSGVIEQNDGYGFKQRLDALEEAGTPVHTIALNTPGGSIDAAKTIGQTIGAMGLTTDVEPGAMCASACVLVFLSGRERVFHAGGRLGVHQSSNSLTHTFSAEGTQDEVDWAGKFRAPTGVTSGMETTAPSGITWLSAEQVKAIGVHYVDGEAETTTALPFVPHMPEHESAEVTQRRARDNALQILFGR